MTVEKYTKKHTASVLALACTENSHTVPTLQELFYCENELSRVLMNGTNPVAIVAVRVITPEIALRIVGKHIPALQNKVLFLDTLIFPTEEHTEEVQEFIEMVCKELEPLKHYTFLAMVWKYEGNRNIYKLLNKLGMSSVEEIPHHYMRHLRKSLCPVCGNRCSCSAFLHTS